MNLKTKAIHGIGWSGTSQIITQILHLAVKIILARLLTPEDFGIIGMALIFIAFIQTINELGLSAAIIQKQNLNERHLSTSFWVSLITGVFFCMASIIASPLIAHFFRESLIQPIIIFLSFGFIFNSLGAVHRAIVEKKIDFKSIAVIETVSAILYGSVSVALALCGFDVWSLVIALLADNAAKSLLLWTVCSWRPSMIFDFKSFKELFRFGRNVMGSGIVQYIAFHTDYFLIAKFLGAASLGLYMFAYKIAVFPLLQISSVVTRVTFPAFSIIQNDNDRIRSGYLKAVKYTSLLTFPMLFGFAIIAPQFVPIAIGEKWTAMILPVQILCVGGAVQSIGTHVGPVLLGKGRSDIHIKWDMFTLAVLPISVLVGLGYGINGVAAAMTTVIFLLSAAIINITNKLIELNFCDFLKVLFPAALCSTVMVASVALFKMISAHYLENTALLLDLIAIGIISYALSVRVIFNDSLKEIKTLIKQNFDG